MNNNISRVLLSLGLLLGSFHLEAQTPEATLEAMEEQLSGIASSDIPDFAPALYKSVQEKVRELRRVLDYEGRLPNTALRDAQVTLETFKSSAGRTKQILSKAYQLRNAALQLNFVRAFNPDLLYLADQTYYEALTLASDKQFDKARMRANLAREQYKSLIRQAQTQMRDRTAGTLNGYQAAIAADLQALNTSSNDIADLAGTESVYQRVKLNFGTGHPGVDGLLEPPWYPEPPVGPQPPVVGIEDRAANSIRLSLTDLSDNETGNRVLRTTDLFNWQVMDDVGPIPRLETLPYTDTNLQSDSRYCYMIESYNAEGARRSQFRCAYTLDGHNIGVWRLQLRVKVANVADAGTDNPLRIRMANNGEHSAAETILDYGRDDFERNSDFTYDLNIEHIRELSDITDLSIINWANTQDVVLIEEIILLVNQREAFSRHFGTTSISALRLGLSGVHRVEHADLRSNPSWQTFVNSSLSNPTSNFPPISIANNGQFQIQIPRDQIVSRIESFVGHMLHTSAEIRSRFKWGHLDGPAVEVKQSGMRAVHIDLDMEATINSWPNPALDLDFDIEVAKRCNNAEGKFIIELTSKNFTSNIDFNLWEDLVSLGEVKIIEELLDWYARTCTTPPEIKQTYELKLRQDTNCDDLNITVDEEANLLICCFAP